MGTAYTQGPYERQGIVERKRGRRAPTAPGSTGNKFEPTLDALKTLGKAIQTRVHEGHVRMDRSDLRLDGARAQPQLCNAILDALQARSEPAQMFEDEVGNVVVHGSNASTRSRQK